MTAPIEICDVYAIAPTRSVQAVNQFLDAFAPNRSPAQDDYPYPQFGHETREWLATAEEAIERMVREPGETYGLYWHVESDDGVRTAMVFFTEDGAMIAGLGGKLDAEAALARMQSVLGAQFGYVDQWEQPPPDSAAEFIEICRNAKCTRLFEGELLKEA